MKNILTTLVCCLLLTGCISQWVKTRSGAEEYTTARAYCEMQAQQIFPVKNEVAQRTKYTTHYEACSKKEDCDGKKIRAVKMPEIESYVMNVNSESWRQQVSRCMSEKGWEYKVQWL